MSEPIPALGGARFDGFAAVEELPPCGMIALRGDLAAEATGRALQSVGLSVPEPLRVAGNGEDAALWMAPDELLLLCAYEAVTDWLDRLAGPLEGSHHLAADVSDARARFRVEGFGLREVLAKLTPADMAPGAFGPGHVRRTPLAQIPAALWLREAETAEVLCFRSVARYAFDLLSNAARPGSEVGHWR